MNDFGGHGWGMGWGWIIGIFLLLLIIWVVVRSLNQNKNIDERPGKSALDILKERYAKGEIDKEEFEARKKDLM